MTAPFTFAWSGVGPGTYALTAKATDNDGATTTTAATTITVSAAPPSNQPPTVTLTTPANGASFNAPASVSLAATASDPNGTVAKVEFFNGTTKLSQDTTAPYSRTWSGVGAGTYGLTAKATDNLGSAAKPTLTVMPASSPRAAATLARNLSAITDAACGPVPGRIRQNSSPP